MPFGFRKSVRLAPGVRLNLGKRSAGISVGPRHAKLSANSRGRRQASTSWRGMFWRKRF
jgi:Protein of unknown function (DUF4236)